MLEILLPMTIGAVLFFVGATWGAWVTLRIHNQQSPLPFTSVDRGGVAYETEDSESDEADDSPYTGHTL